MSSVLRTLGAVTLLTQLCQAGSPLTFEQKRANVLKAKTELLACAERDDARGLIAQVETGMLEGASASCESNQQMEQLTGQLQGIRSVLRNADVVEAKFPNEIKLAETLRFHTLKNALMTYLDAEIRYNLDAPKAQTFYKANTAVLEVCKGGRGENTCTPEQIAELKSLVHNYRTDFRAKNIETLTAKEALARIDERLAGLNLAYLPVQKANEEVTKIAPSYGDTVGASTAAVRSQLRTKVGSQLVLPEQKRYQAAYERLMAESQEGEGLLLYTSTLRNHLSQQSDGHKEVGQAALVAEAVREVKRESLKLARETNDQLTGVLGRERAVKSIESRSSVVYDSHESLKKMLKTNPIAAGQLLVEYPEYARDVCSLSILISKDDRNDRRVQKGLEVAMWGGMVVGGVLMLTGVLTPAGVALEAASASTLGTLTAVNTGLGVVSLTGNVGYMTKRHFDLKETVSQNQQALLAKTGGSLRAISASEKELDEELGNAALLATRIVAPLGLAKLGAMARGSALFKNTTVVRSIADLQKSMASSPSAQKGLRILDYICGMLGVTSCELLTSTLGRLPPHQREQVLASEQSLAKFTKETLEGSPGSKIAVKAGDLQPYLDQGHLNSSYLAMKHEAFRKAVNERNPVSIEEFKRNANKTPTYIVELDGKMTGIFKPETRTGEAKALSDASNEVVASVTSDLFGFDLVPKTSFKEIRINGVKQRGSFQLVVPDSETVFMSRGRPMSETDRIKMDLFDALTGESDRHGNNRLIDKNGKVYAIDNGASFIKGEERINRDFELPTRSKDYTIELHNEKLMAREVALGALKDKSAVARFLRSDEGEALVERFETLDIVQIRDYLAREAPELSSRELMSYSIRIDTQRKHLLEYMERARSYRSNLFDD